MISFPYARRPTEICFIVYICPPKKTVPQRYRPTAHRRRSQPLPPEKRARGAAQPSPEEARPAQLCAQRVFSRFFPATKHNPGGLSHNRCLPRHIAKRGSTLKNVCLLIIIIPTETDLVHQDRNQDSMTDSFNG